MEAIFAFHENFAGTKTKQINVFLRGTPFAHLQHGAAESLPENRLQRLSPSWPG